MYRTSIAALIIGAALASTASAESLSDLMAKRKATNGSVVTVKMACGKQTKSNCSQVLPRLDEHSVPGGLTLSPFNSEGSTESANGVCLGLAETAIGQADAIALVAQQPECINKFDRIGAPLYPYYGYFIVKASSDVSSVDSLVGAVAEGKHLSVAVGKDGSGGQTTMTNILKHNAGWKRVIDLKDYDDTTAPQRILDGTLDGYFVMDGPGSGLIDGLKTQADRDGNPVFKFLDLRPGDEVLALTDWNGKPIYQSATLAKGCWVCHDTLTISTPAVVIVNNEWRESPASHGAADKLAKAIYDAQAAIYGDTHTPADWKAQ